MIAKTKHGIEFKIDEEDFNNLYPFYTFNMSGKYIAGTRIGDGKRTHLHRLITKIGNFGTKIVVDHKNRDKLDCRRKNLRIVSQSLNAANKEIKKTAGIKFCPNKTKKYRAGIKKDQKYIHIGYFLTQEEAHQAYLNKRTELFGL